MGGFATLEVERRLDVGPATAWAAWTAPVARRIWSSPGRGTSVEIPRAETRIGGLELSICRVAGQPDTHVETRWLELDPPHRSVNSEVVSVGGGPLASALVTAEVSGGAEIGDAAGEAAATSLLRLTVQISSLQDGMAQAYEAGFAAGLAGLEALTHRLMVVEREIAAEPAALWQAWSDPALLPLWWGPDGFTCRTKRIDLRAGGEWVFDMIGPDGTVYPNHHRYGAFDGAGHLSYALHHGENGPLHAQAWAQFTAVPAGTRVTLGMVFASETECRGAKAFGAETLGFQTLGKLARAAGAS